MHTFEERLTASWSPEHWQDRTILLAVSGGADSVAMFRVLHGLKAGGTGQLLVAHFNHRLRGEASDADAQFVATLGQTLGVTVYSGSAEESAGAGSEETFRADRYEFLQQTAEKVGARYVVTAHTLDDQVETILHRILRGTGIAGLAGIPRTRSLGDAAVLMRPMLGIPRYEVLDYLESLKQPFCEDATNRSGTYTRNRIRHELLPLLAREYNPNISDALLQLGQLASDAQAIIKLATDDLIHEHAIVASPTSVEIDCGTFTSCDRAVVRELLASVWRRQAWPLADMGFREWNRLAGIAIADSPHIMDLPGRIRAQKKGESLSLTRLL